jgi:hypothetical protein
MEDQPLPFEVIIGVMREKLGQHLQTLHEIEKPTSTDMLAYATAGMAWMQAASILKAMERRGKKIETWHG